jgi:hypothetical protein
MGFRSGKQVSDLAVAVGGGVRRWDGYCLHADWHRDRVVEAIKTAPRVLIIRRSRMPLRRQSRGSRPRGYWQSAGDRRRKLKRRNAGGVRP